MVMDRWIRDNELSIWAASGVGLRRLLKPLVTMGLVLAFIIAMFALFIAPGADVKAKSTQAGRSRACNGVGNHPGVFNEAQNGQAVYYVEEVGLQDNTLRNIFVYGDSSEKRGRSGC